MIIEKKVIQLAKVIIEQEGATLLHLANTIDDKFEKVIHIILNNSGRLIVSGIGKSALVGRKIVATFNSTGTPAQFLHAADAIHGDLGMIGQEDLVLFLSQSGNTSELLSLLPYLKSKGIKIISMVGNENSELARNSDYLLPIIVKEEADPNLLAPSSSSIAQMAIGDALAFCLAKLKGFSPQNFANFHPGGNLGKRMHLTIGTLAEQNSNPKVFLNTNVNDLILEISSKRLGAAAVIDNQNKVLGIITDGDLRRMLKTKREFNSLSAKDIMSSQPKTMASDALAKDALEMMNLHSITQIIITENDKYVGMVHLHDIIKEGIE